MKAKNVFSACLILSLVACSSEKPKQTVTPLPMTGVFKSQSMRVGDTDKVIIVDVPDYYMPRRCVIYVGKASSNMDCTFDASDSATAIAAIRSTD